MIKRKGLRLNAITIRFNAIKLFSFEMELVSSKYQTTLGDIMFNYILVWNTILYDIKYGDIET